MFRILGFSIITRPKKTEHGFFNYPISNQLAPIYKNFEVAYPEVFRQKNIDPFSQLLILKPSFEKKIDSKTYTNIHSKTPLSIGEIRKMEPILKAYIQEAKEVE